MIYSQRKKTREKSMKQMQKVRVKAIKKNLE